MGGNPLKQELDDKPLLYDDPYMYNSYVTWIHKGPKSKS
jgi:hypothetical protein